MTLVDTSAWIDFFRGSGALAGAVDTLLEEGEAALCGPVMTEIRRGIRSPAERRRVLDLLEGCHHLEEPARLWDDAGDLGSFLGRRGTTAKTLDLLIATYALVHALPILTRDRDFEIMSRAGVDLQLARSTQRRR